jgi:asparagine synthase (glutamine-hydrolysing)
VRRLGPGRRLERRAGGEVREVGADALPAPRRLSSRRLEDAVEALDHVLEDAVRRHVPPGEVGLLLTGGRDSRLLAGYLARAGRRVRAFTLGRAHDAEVRIARSVARRLGVPHEHAETEPEAHTEHVALVGRYEALSAGGSGTDKWSMARLLRFAPASTVAGLAMDSIVGPAFSVWGGARQDRGASYAGAVAFLDAWGLGAEAIRGLLRPEHADAAAEVERLVRREWEDEPGDDVARAWRFVLRHRHRFHTGAFAHAVAFASWPAFPAVDRRVLESCFQEPPAVLGERRAEDALLRRRFPELASLPVDRNAWDDLPLLPSVPRRVGAALERRVRPIRRARRAWRRRHGDPRRYYRTYDVNAETWRAARQRAEAGREAAHAFLRPEALAALLPPPDARIEAADPIASTAPVRSLIALLAWLAESEGSLRDSTVGGAPRGAPGRA